MRWPGKGAGGDARKAKKKSSAAPASAAANASAAGAVGAGPKFFWGERWGASSKPTSAGGREGASPGGKSKSKAVAYAAETTAWSGGRTSAPGAGLPRARDRGAGMDPARGNAKGLSSGRRSGEEVARGGKERPELWPAVLLRSIHKFTGDEFRRGRRPGEGVAEAKKRIADTLVSAEVRSRKLRSGVKRRVAAGVGLVRGAVAQIQSDFDLGGNGANPNASAGGGGPDSPGAVGGVGGNPSSDRNDNNRNGNNGNKSGHGNAAASSSASPSPSSLAPVGGNGGTDSLATGTGLTSAAANGANGVGVAEPAALQQDPYPAAPVVPEMPSFSTLSSAAYEKLQQARESLVIPPFLREFNDQIKGGFPNKRRLDVVQEFFKYTEDEARCFFNELDRNKDGVVTLEDMKAEMRRRNLPEKYAKSFIKRAKRHAKWPFGNSIVWEDFRSLNQERECAMLANFNALDVSQFGSLKKHQVKTLLAKMQFQASDDNAESMLKYLDADASGYVSYGKYRNFLILIPKEKIEAKDIGLMWFESATMVPMIVPDNSSKKMLVLSTLASAVISGTSTLALHPLDTVKTMLQASKGGSIVSVFKDAAKMGRTGVYRGIIPATVGAASSQGFRVGVFEAVKLGTRVLLPSIPDLQVQTIASGMGSFIGTAVRIPCEVLKQRLQAGQYPGVWQATTSVMKKDGVKGLFRGSAATLSREIPFYVIGMVAYEQFKKAAVAYSLEKRGREDLEAWETIALGALSGALAAALTTPFDVLKTRLMTSAIGAQTVPITTLAKKLVAEEGPAALFKGALPRALWIAPVGAMNFAGYELAKNAMSSAQE